MSNQIDTAKSGQAIAVRSQLGMISATANDVSVAVVIAALMNALARIDQLETRVAQLDGESAL